MAYLSKKGDNVSENISICRTVTVDLSKVKQRFPTDSVTTQRPRPSKRSMAEYLGVIMPGKKIEHVARKDMLAVGYRPVPSSLFFQAVHECFSNHYALTLRPEVLMHIIVHEVAYTVKANVSDYRHLFTRLVEKDRIDVRHDGLRLGDPNSPWGEAIDLFEKPLAERMPSDIMAHLLPPFTTATPESRTASLVAFMDAASPYYDYHTHTMCGIPEVRLAGAADDYRRLRNAAGKLAETFGKHLEAYFHHLLPVLDELVRTAEGGHPDERFWSSIYKHESHSGSSVFNGWISAFVNYVNTGDKTVVKRPDIYDWTDMAGGWGIKGLSLGSVPSQVCAVPFNWHYYGETKKMLFAGGPLGVEEQDGAVMPVLSYAVLHA